ncbi:MAG: polyphosphate kinase 1 [Gemmatimonadaceae bacterium]|nr:polyphosphate kinase 1 [Gemmatimonadaceae bacterium]
MTVAGPQVPASPYFNRELSWLAFNARVLREAADPRVPLLERLKFIAIFSTNLDEFFMVRVAGLRRQATAGVAHSPPDGLTPTEQLAAIRDLVGSLLDERAGLLAGLLIELAAHGVTIGPMDALTPGERSALDGLFESQIFPVLTPLAMDPSHPFPYLSNLSLSLAVEVRDPERNTEHFARVKVPKSLPRFIAIAGRPHHFVPLEQVIGENLDALFPGMEVIGWYPFRITRYSDLEISSAEEPEDLLATIEEQVFRRRFGEVIRLEVQNDMPPALRALLLDELQDVEEPGLTLGERDFEDGGDLLDLSDLHSLAQLELPELRDPPFSPSTPHELRDPERSIFDVIRERDLLVHHPFESFHATVERFLDAAAHDDNVLAIKCTLYRTSGDTAIVRALTEAAQRGKQVAVVVELKARFDEANNISWARQLESFGVHVSYGSPELKVHTKTVLVIRREGDAIRRYVHIGTGNYNSKTARLYTDIGLFTCSPSVGADVSDLFNSLTGIARQRYYRKLLVAPANLRDRLIALIDREASHARNGRPARVIAKMNALVDADVIDALYRASEAGVRIDLVVRGICCLRPGVPGMSDRIRVVSVIGRFLEHSRIIFFANDGEGEFYIGSADWMPRNFIRRVEVAVPVDDPVLQERLRGLLDTLLADDRQAWDLQSDGSWIRREPADDTRGTHAALLLDPWGRRTGSERHADVASPFTEHQG